MNSQSAAIAVGWRKPAWIALLVAASVAFTLGFACATPLAAFAAVAALTMTRRDALLLVGLVWLANQCVGFSVLHYPWTAECLAWGAGLGVIALFSVFAAEFSARRLSGLKGISLRSRLSLPPLLSMKVFCSSPPSSSKVGSRIMRRQSSDESSPSTPSPSSGSSL